VRLAWFPEPMMTMTMLPLLGHGPIEDEDERMLLVPFVPLMLKAR